MGQKKKNEFLSKVVKFGTKSVTLFSLDGNTWSTRKAELQGILDRHEAERQKLLQNMGEAKAVEESEKVASKPSDDEEETSDDAPIIVGDDADVNLVSDEGEELDEEQPVAKKSSKVAKRSLEPASIEKAKAKKSQRQQKGKEKVAFVTPKPRQIGKKKVKANATKSKKRSAA